jgi:hypothetical protein
VFGAALLALASSTPALSARLAPAVTAVQRGATLLLVGTGFAPPIEFCRSPVVRIDGRPAAVTGRLADDNGGWAIRVRITQAPGRHVATMAQTCTSGNTGQARTTTARAGFRVFR